MALKTVFAFLFLIGIATPAHAEEIPMTINGQINCAHPDNAITTTCKGEETPPPAPAPTTTTTEAPPPGTTITHSGDVAINCGLPENKDNNICLPMTNPDGSINCQQADNAITTTCWERSQAEKSAGSSVTPEVDCSLDRFKDYPACTGIKPTAVIDNENAKAASSNVPVPTVTTNPVITIAAPPGTTITYSGDIAINCGLPENFDNNICLPMTYPDGTINCQQADNAITTTCWERAQAEKQAGDSVVPEVDCSLDRFKEYPVCTGIKPQAVIDYEKSREVLGETAPNTESEAETKTESGNETKEPIAQEPAPVLTEEPKSEDKQTESAKGVEENGDEPVQEVEPVSGSLSLKNLKAKSTIIEIDLNTPALEISIVATKKGAPSITRTVTVDDEGDRTVKFSKNLKGYLIKIIVDGETIDKERI